jgi:hypothetical protein
MAQAARVAGLGQALEAVPDAPAGRVPQCRGLPQQDLAGLLRLRAQPLFFRFPFPLGGRG